MKKETNIKSSSKILKPAILRSLTPLESSQIIMNEQYFKLEKLRLDRIYNYRYAAISESGRDAVRDEERDARSDSRHLLKYRRVYRSPLIQSDDITEARRLNRSQTNLVSENSIRPVGYRGELASSNRNNANSETIEL